MLNYSYNAMGAIVRSTDGATIPKDPNNSDYQNVLSWITSGNTIQPYIPPPLTQDQLDVQAANAYTKLTALKSMTPAQIQNWVQANVTTLAQAQDAITTLAIAVAILARRL